jgi:hypothetical protein
MEHFRGNLRLTCRRLRGRIICLPRRSFSTQCVRMAQVVKPVGTSRVSICSRIRRSRAAAVLMAVALAFAQMVAAGHFHHFDSTRGIGTPAQIAPDSGTCLLCALTCHWPIKPVVAPTIASPTSTTGLMPVTCVQFVFGAPFSAWRTRAPPEVVL